MNTLFAREVYIRLTDDNESFVCTVRYGKLYGKTTEFALHPGPTPGVLEEKALVLVRRHSAGRAAREE